MKISQSPAREDIEDIRAKINDKRRARKEATHRAIQEAAEHLALTQGQAAITTKALVKEAGVSERTIFNHFSNIDEILLSCLGMRLSEIVKPEDFPRLEDKAELPRAVDDFLLGILQDEKTNEPLGRFVSLAKTFNDTEDIGEAVGKDIFRTLLEMGWGLETAIEEKHPQLSLEERFRLGIYINSLVNSFAYGLGFYIYQNQEELAEDIENYSLSEMRQSMIWAVQSASAGKPDFS